MERPPIAVDCRMAEHSGIGTYLRNLLGSRAYREAAGDLALLGDPGLLSGSPGRVFPYRAPIYSLREQWAVLGAHRRARWRLLHAPHYNFPLLCPTPVVVTVHDMIHWIFPEQLPSRAAWLYARFFFRHGLRRAARIITDSECTRRDLVEKARLPGEKIEVIPLAAGPDFRPAGEGEVERLRARLSLPRQYFLYVGNIRPLKNVPLLVETFRGLTPSLDGDLELVLAGKDYMPDWTRSAGSERVRFLGLVPAADLPALYSGALAFVFPSLYEGFGLPPLEAMACGTPVIAARAGALPEALGEAPRWIDPRSRVELAQALRALAGDPALRAALRARGLEQVKRFSWEVTAERTLRACRAALDGAPRPA